MPFLIDKIHSKVVGTSYRTFDWGHIHAKDMLDIQHEPGNRFDPKALAIIHKKAGHLGYVDAKSGLNAQLYQDIRKGRDVYAQVTAITGEGKDNQGINIEIFVVED